MLKKQWSGVDTDNVKVVIYQGQLSNLHKIGKYGKEIGEKLVT